MLSDQRRTVPRSIRSTELTRRTNVHPTVRFPRDGRAHPRRRRRPRRACDAALRVPDPGPRARARAGSRRRSPGAAVRRRTDGAARQIGPRLVEGRRRPARIADPPGLGHDPVGGAGGRTAAAASRERLRHGWIARDRARDRAALRPRRREADRDRLSPQRPRGRGGGGGAARGGRRAGARAGQRHVGAGARRGGGARPARRARPQRGDRRRPRRRSTRRTSTGTGR